MIADQALMQQLQPSPVRPIIDNNLLLQLAQQPDPPRPTDLDWLIERYSRSGNFGADPLKEQRLPFALALPNIVRQVSGIDHSSAKDWKEGLDNALKFGRSIFEAPIESGENFIKAWREGNPEQMAASGAETALNLPTGLDDLAMSAAKHLINYGGHSAPLAMMAFHGSPHKFDKFSLEKIGTGEGNQAYGYGLYFAGDKKIAEWYKNKLAPVGDKGQLYNVDIPDNSKMLDWDKPLRNQGDKIQPILEQIKRDIGDEWLPEYEDRLNLDFSEWQGKDLYNVLKKIASEGSLPNQSIYDLGTARHASEYLKVTGIPGHKYLDNPSRSKSSGNHNYVIYDDSLIKMMPGVSE
jgi:hypothetical protein